MPNEYIKRTKQIRRKVSKLTLNQQKKLAAIYRQSMYNLANQVSDMKPNTMKALLKNNLLLEIAKTNKLVEKQIIAGIKETVAIGVLPTKEQMEKIMQASLNLSITEVGLAASFAKVQSNVINDIIKGNLYKDSKTLSQRIWNYGKGIEKDIQQIIAQGLLEKKSPINLAADLEQFVKDPAKRPTSWGKSYPTLKNKKVDYNAMRLARTSINHAYQMATIQGSKLNPFVEGIRWESALKHGRTCALCMERHGQFYKHNNVPLDHPNGLCTMVPEITKSFNAMADELKSWANGGTNKKMDKWAKAYGFVI